jgi:hypothetical protein
MAANGPVPADLNQFVWDATNGARDIKTVLQNTYGLNLTGWSLNVSSISEDGLTFVGTGTNPSGLTEAWIAQIPEPGSKSLFGLGMAVLFGCLIRACRPKSKPIAP